MPPHSPPPHSPYELPDHEARGLARQALQMIQSHERDCREYRIESRAYRAKMTADVEKILENQNRARGAMHLAKVLWGVFGGIIVGMGIWIAKSVAAIRF